MGQRREWTQEELSYLQENWTLPDTVLSEKVNHPIGSIRSKRLALGLIGKPGECQKAWSQEELDYLHEVWGEKTIPEIAKKLGRSINAVKIKSVRCGYLGQKWSGEMMSARKVSKLLGVDVHAVIDYWIPKCNLKAKRKRLGESKKTTTIIMFEDLLKWLEEHQDLWDSRRIELYGLGMEYDWLVEKRKRDAQLPRRKAQKWNPYEDSQLILMWKRGDKTKAEIAEILNRPVSGVEHRLARIDVWGTGKYVSDEERAKKKGAIKENFERKGLAIRLVNALRAYRNSMEYGEYWQKDMCQHWDEINGCTAGERNCDECAKFQRIHPQNCVRCGATFYERKPNRICERCRIQRKKQGYRKYLRMKGGNK